MRCSAALLALALAACDRPSPLVLCHNANCASPDVTRDDTLDALRESLALTYDGRPVLDGMEWDTFWHGAEGRCLFAHDLAGDTTTSPSAASAVIADYLAATPTPSHGDRFYTFIELKGFVGTSFSDAHTPEQLVLHADCALDAAEQIAAGARLGAHRITIGFVSISPAMFDVLITRPRWSQLAADPELELLLVGDIFAPYDSIVPELADYKVPLDGVEFHPDYMTQTTRETYRSLGIDLVQWSFITTTEALASIERWEPRYVITNEAMLLRRWVAD